MRLPDTTLNRRGFLALGTAALLATGAKAAPLAGLSGIALGTGWSVALPAGADTAGLRDRLAALLAGMDRAFSPFRADSALGRFNGGGEEAAVSAEVVDVTRAALSIAEASGGAFDPTVGPLVARWGFGPIRDGETTAEGWRAIRAGNGHLARERRGLTLDLCGIAKGHALDRMAALLRDAGHAHFLIDLGGELFAEGRHPSGRLWQVGVEDPRPGREGMAATLKLSGMAVATSGDRVNGYDLGTRRYSHIIDPAAGEPVESTLASVSVLMPDARTADGWATALMAAGNGGPALARRRGIPALFLFRAENGLSRVATAGFETHLL